MTRQLRVVDAADAAAVLEALGTALSGDGPAILPHGGAPAGLPDTVAQRVAVVVETSGSTGRPKRVALSADALLAGAAASDVLLGGPGRWLLAVPAHYIAGVNVLVRSLASQTAPVVMPPGSFTPERFVDAAAQLETPHRYTSLVPAQLARLIESDAATDALRHFSRILVGGQSMPASLAQRATDLGLPITRTYGSSETAGGCVWNGVPIGNTELAIRDGRIEIAGSMLAEGYLGDPDRTAAAFIERDGQRWYRTDDTGEIVDGVLRVIGRVDDVIISGGLKVSLAAVQDVVRALPGLADAIVVGAPHPVWGESPVVVTTVDAPLEQVRAAVAALGPAAAPSRIIVVASIPMLQTGKPDRLALAELALQ